MRALRNNIVILVLCVVLLAIIVGIVVSLSRNAKPIPSQPQLVDWASNISNGPDGSISKIGNLMYFAAQYGPVIYDEHTQQTTMFSLLGDTSSFNASYAAPGSVVYYNGKYFMFYHAERHECEGIFPFRAGIGLATSTDGKTWTNNGQIMSSWEANPGCAAGRPSGVGYPSVVIKDNFAFMFYVGWFPGTADGIYVAKCPVVQLEYSCWSNYTNTGGKDEWNELGMGGKSTKVLDRPSLEDSYIAAPQVQLIDGAFVGTFETNLGFVMAKSEDGIHWSNPVQIFKFPVPHDKAQLEDWYSYPSVLRDGSYWFLYYAQKTSVQGHEGEHLMHRQMINLPF